MSEEAFTTEFSDEELRRAEWIKRGVVFFAMTFGILAGFFLDLPWNREPEAVAPRETLEAVTKENFKETISRDEVLTVMNLQLDGNPNSDKLKEILENIEAQKPYGDKVACAEWDLVANQPAGTKPPDPAQFAGQLDFYAKGQKLGSLKGETDPAVVDATIRRYLAGLVKRYGPGWLPDVRGLEKGADAEQIIKVEEADPTTAPAADKPRPAAPQSPAPSPQKP